jgi:hypothetical protein
MFDVEPKLLDPEFSNSYDFNTCWTANNRDGPFHDVDVAAAFVASSMNLSGAARLLNRSRRSLELYILRHPLLSEFVAEMEAGFLDAVEHLHRHAALTGDLQTQRFFLTTKAKNRGYVVRNETTGKDGEPLLPPTVDWTQVSTEAMEELLLAKGRLLE